MAGAIGDASAIKFGLHVCGSENVEAPNMSNPVEQQIYMKQQTYMNRLPRDWCVRASRPEFSAHGFSRWPSVDRPTHGSRSIRIALIVCEALSPTRALPFCSIAVR